MEFVLVRITIVLAVSFFFCSVAFAATGSNLWTIWNVSDEENIAVIDHSLWQDVLGKYVVEGGDGINRVDYDGLRQGPDRRMPEEYIQLLSSIDPRMHNSKEQLAYWINLYNALTINIVLGSPEKKSIRSMGRGFFSFGPWDDEVANVAGVDISLNDIEHRILRPIWRDHRIHFAVNCASLGCPNLVRHAYQSSNVEELLAKGEHAYINHVRGVTFTEQGELLISSIFDWYGEDFAPSKQALLQYLSDHHDTRSDDLKSYTGSVDYDYDWSLNAATNQ